MLSRKIANESPTRPPAKPPGKPSSSFPNGMADKLSVMPPLKLPGVSTGLVSESPDDQSTAQKPPEDPLETFPDEGGWKFVRSQLSYVVEEAVGISQKAAESADGRLSNPDAGLEDQYPETPTDIVNNQSRPAIRIFEELEVSRLFISRYLMSPIKSSYGPGEIPDQALVKIPPAMPQPKESFQSKTRTTLNIHVPERWEIDRFEPQLWLRRTLDRPSTLVSYPWSELELARLWAMTEHLKWRIEDMDYQTIQFNNYFHEAINYKNAFKLGKWCSQCKKDTATDKPTQRKRLKLDKRIWAGQGYAEAEAAKVEAQGRRKPGELGTIKEIVRDDWDDEVVIETIYWTEENTAQFIREEERLFQKKRTHYGCWGHTGHAIGNFRHWSCCRGAETSPGCTAFEQHKILDEASLHTMWYLHEAPVKRPADFRQAVVLDCQMGKNKWGQDELIKVTAIDYFSGEILVDQMVWPSVPLWHTAQWTTGINWDQLEQAHRSKSTIEGRDAARELLFRFVGCQTILMLHGGGEDLVALRITHQHILDAKYLSDIDPPPELDAMANRFLGRHVQPQKVRKTLNDAITCRALVRHFTTAKEIPEIHEPGFDIMGNGEAKMIASEWEKFVKAGGLDFTTILTRPRFLDVMLRERQKGDFSPISTQRVPYLKKYREYKPSPHVPVVRDNDWCSLDENGNVVWL